MAGGARGLRLGGGGAGAAAAAAGLAVRPLRRIVPWPTAPVGLDGGAAAGASGTSASAQADRPVAVRTGLKHVFPLVAACQPDSCK